MMNSFSGKSFIDNLLAFWLERLKDYCQRNVISDSEKLEIDVIEGLLHADAPYRLWEECQSGLINEKTIHEVEKVDEAIFKLKFRILPLSDVERQQMVDKAVGFESLVVFCICNSLRREGRLIEE